MDDAGLQLLRSIEVLMREVRDELRTDREGRQTINAKRQQRYRDRRKGGSNVTNVTTERNVTKRNERNVTIVTQTDLSTKELQEQDLKAVALRNDRNADHPDLIAHFVGVVKKATAKDYRIGPVDGKYAKDMLKQFGLAESKRIIDLAAGRYAADAWYRRRGLTLRYVASEANALLTGKTEATINGADKGRVIPNAQETRAYLDEQERVYQEDRARWKA